MAGSMPSLSDVPIFLDFEASSLSGWPVEIGLAWYDKPGPKERIQSLGFLIRPEPGWDEADWDVLAEEVHGIGLDDLRQEGTPAMDVARAVARLVTGRTLVSDAAGFDAHLLARLFEALPEPAPEVCVLDVTSLLRKLSREAAVRYEAALAEAPIPHRAGPDAIRLARAWRSCQEPGAS